MAGVNPWGLLAALFGFGLGFAAGRLAMLVFERRHRVVKTVAEGGHDALLVWVKRAAALLDPLTSRLLRSGPIKRAASDLAQACEERGFAWGEAASLSALLLVATAAFLVVSLVTRSVACGAAVACCAVLAVTGWTRSLADRRLVTVREEVPEALRSMGVCFRSGLSLVQTLHQTAREMRGPLGRRFEVAAQRLEMGGTPEEALATLQGDGRISELSFVAVALDVQHQCGGSIAPVLDSAREAVENDLGLRRSLRVQTAQAKLSAQVVTMMPFVLVALFSLMSSDFLTPFFSSLPGMVLLSLALLMQFAGVMLVRRMLQVEAG